MGNQALLWQSAPEVKEVAAFPGKLRTTPMGSIEVQLPNTKEIEAEHLRDLARNLRGGGLLLVARQNIRQLHAEGDDAVVVGAQAPDGEEAHYASLTSQLREELLHQGHGLQRKDSRSYAFCRCFYHRRKQQQSSWMDVHSLRQLVSLISAHTSVASVLHAAGELDLPPIAWQSLFAICIGAGQVRVLSFCFIGEPVLGDRPENKRTPFVLNLISDDLILAVKEKVAPLTLRQHFVGQRTADGVQTTSEHLASFGDQLFEAIDNGDWDGLAHSHAILRSIAI